MVGSTVTNEVLNVFRKVEKPGAHKLACGVELAQGWIRRRLSNVLREVRHLRVKSQSRRKFDLVLMHACIWSSV